MEEDPGAEKGMMGAKAQSKNERGRLGAASWVWGEHRPRNRIYFLREPVEQQWAKTRLEVGRSWMHHFTLLA